MALNDVYANDVITQISDVAQIQTIPSFDACSDYLQVTILNFELPQNIMHVQHTSFFEMNWIIITEKKRQNQF